QSTALHTRSARLRSRPVVPSRGHRPCWHAAAVGGPHSCPYRSRDPWHTPESPAYFSCIVPCSVSHRGGFVRMGLPARSTGAERAGLRPSLFCATGWGGLYSLYSFFVRY